MPTSIPRIMLPDTVLPVHSSSRQTAYRIDSDPYTGIRTVQDYADKGQLSRRNTPEPAARAKSSDAPSAQLFGCALLLSGSKQHISQSFQLWISQSPFACGLPPQSPFTSGQPLCPVQHAITIPWSVMEQCGLGFREGMEVPPQAFGPWGNI